MENKLLNVVKKLFAGQRVIYESEAGFLVPKDIEALKAYNKIAIATRCVNVIVDYAVPVELDVYKKNKQTYIKVDDASKVDKFIDFPNPYQDKYKFWALHYLYLLLYGSSFIVLENDGLYILNPTMVEVIPDPKKYVSKVAFGFGAGRVQYDPKNVMMVTLPSMDSQYIGKGVFDKLKSEVNLVNKMLAYHDAVLKTGGIHKFVFRTENILGAKIKERIREEWKQFHSFGSADAGLPPILEGGLSLDKINITMDDLDFNKSVERLEKNIMANLGVPPELIFGGENSNIEKILKLFFITTVLPLVERTCSAFTLLMRNNAAWFRIGSKEYYVRPNINSVYALREDIDKVAKAAQGLYVSGIINKNEARVRNNFPETDKGDEFMTPANIAGSNLNPSQGGRPPKDDSDKDDE